ncbi:hypothetical protein NXY56_000147 [Leishmania guyanensis]
MFSSPCTTATGNGYEASNVAELRWSSASGPRSGVESKGSMALYSGSAGTTPPLGCGSDSVAAAASIPPAGHVTFSTADLVDRSAFLFGLLQSDHLVHDVHDAISVLNSVAADKADDGDPRGRAAGGRGGGEGALSAVFYFIARSPSPDMPWRPTYTSAVLLCIFSTAEAAQRAVARVNGVLLHTMQTEVRDSTSMAQISSPYLVLRPAREFALGPEHTDTALLTYLTTPRLVDLLLRRQRKQKPHDRVADDVEQRSAMESYTRANLPPAYLCGSAARLYAAILSPQSPYAVDWAAARVAMDRGDGIVVPEMSVVEPWACGGAGGYDREKNSTSIAAGTPPVDKGSPLLLQGADIERRRRAGVAGAARYIPMTLQEEEYYRRYGSGSPNHTASNRARCGSVEGLTELMPSRGSLYRGAQGVLHGVSWFCRRAYESLGGKEAALISGPSSLPAAPAVPSASPQAPPTPTGTSNQVPFAGSATEMSETRDFYEPPRVRHRVEGGGLNGVRDARRGGAQAIMIPRYNAAGSALSWLPGFHYVAPLFVTGSFLLGGTAPPPPQRRRMREEESGKEAQVYGIVSAGGWRRDGTQALSYSSLNRAEMPAPFSDSAGWGDLPRHSKVSTAPQRAALSPVLWNSPAGPSQSLPSPPPLYPADASQAAPGAGPPLDSLLPTPMVSSIAPSRSYMPLQDDNFASSSENASVSALWRPHTAAKSHSTAASSRGSRDYIRADDVDAAGGGSRGARHAHTAGSGTPLVAGTLRRDSATRFGGAKSSGTLADELRAFAGSTVAGPHGRTGSQDEMRTTAADTALGGQGGRKSSSRTSRRTVEFSLPDGTK